MSQLNKSAKRILFIIDGGGRFLGTCTDGDIRRGLLNGLSLDDSVENVVSKQYLAANEGDDYDKFQRLMEVHQLDGVPVLDVSGSLIDIWLPQKSKDNVLLQPVGAHVLIMAGGRGERLLPLTATTPKPLLPLNGSSPLETLLRRLASQGFQEVTIATHYMAARIRDYIGNGDEIGLSVAYMEEETPLGTAGALGLLTLAKEQPILVVNADVITDARLDSFVKVACQVAPVTTVGLVKHVIQIPYGVAQVSDENLLGVIEKPASEHLVLAGVTLVAPATQRLVEPGEPLHMTELLDRARREGHQVKWRDLDAYWVDMGSREMLSLIQDTNHSLSI